MALALAIFASGAGSTAQAVIDACASGRIDGEVVLVISNNSDAPVRARAAAAGIASRHLSRATHPQPDELDVALVQAARAAGATHVLLAGYMRPLGPAMLEAFAAHGGRGMYGDRVHAAVLAAGDQRSGATVHLVIADYDAGPIVAAAEVPVLADDDVASLGERVRAAERELVVEVLSRAALNS
jgi:phosphoribosylglycinamide formyltransferase-1